MADTKISALTATTSMSTDDLVPVVDDPGGTPATKKITFDNFQKSITNVTGTLSTGVVTVTTTTGALSSVAAPTGTIVGNSDTQTLTNKTIDADSNTITNIENADIKAAAAIAVNKLAAVTASRALVSDVSGFVSAATTTSTEIGYVNGVTSAIQTQLDAKQPLDSDLTTIAGLTATTDNFIQSKSSAWSSRTPTQVTADLIAMVGDSGSGGTKGLVPPPASGDAAASKFLKADGVWTTPSGGRTLCRFTALDGNPPAANYATFDTRNSISVLDFDGGSTNEETVFQGIIPEAAVLTSGILVRIHWMATSATSGNCRWGVQFERGTTDLDSDSFDTATEAHSATNGTSGIITTTEITATSIDSIVAGDPFRIKVYRDASDTSNDTMTGDAELISVELRSVV